MTRLLIPLIVGLQVVAGLLPGSQAAASAEPLSSSYRQPAGVALPRLEGLPLTEALRLLQGAGLELVFSSRVVRASMTVSVEPEGETLREILAELLASHGLSYRDSGDRLVVVRSSRAGSATVVGVVQDRWTRQPLAGATVSLPAADVATTTDSTGAFRLDRLSAGKFDLVLSADGYPDLTISIRIRDGRQTRLIVDMDIPVAPLEEIVVTPSHVSVSRSAPDSAVQVDMQDILERPTPGDDVFRAAATLAGTASNDLTADFSLRGGRGDEVMVTLDGLELFEPFHMKDLGNVLSVVPAQIIESMELSSGSFSAAYGDRMGGVLDLRTREATTRLSGHAGLSPYDVALDLRGQSQTGRASWLLSGRKGLVGEVLESIDLAEDPHFWDFFGKGQLQLAGNQSLGFRLLRAKDDFSLAPSDATAFSEETSTYTWLTHEAVLGRSVFVSTRAYRGDIGGFRRGLEDSDTTVYDVSDRRRVEMQGIAQHWNYQFRPKQSWKWGVSTREVIAAYDYLSNVDRFHLSPYLLSMGPSSSSVDFEQTFEGYQSSGYGSYRSGVFDRLTFELGLRYDDNRLVGDHHASPRLSAALATGKRGVLRVGWGYYYQSQRPHELEVADGETFFPVDERSEQFVLGYEHFFDNGMALRAETYRRGISDPRLRYHNLFDPISLFPEVEADRIQIVADSSESEGIEVSLRRSRRLVGFRLGYTFARVADRIGGREVPRALDQRHALLGGFDLSLGQRFTLAINGSVHTGWPTTSLELTTPPGGEPILVLGPRNEERLPDYYRFDARLSRSFQLQRGTLTWYVDVLNFLGRRNVRGYEFEIEGEDGQLRLERESLSWGRVIPTTGVRFEF
jgi:hypothetical protein